MSEPLLLTIVETAALLRVSVDTIKRSIRSGIIPAKRLRCTVRISRLWVDAFVLETAPVLLSRKQVARKLGISVDTVTRLQRRGVLPTVKIGGVQRIPVAGAPLPLRAPAPHVAAQPRRSPWSSMRGV